MTNTLHRFGKPEEQTDDYLIFVMASKGANDVGSTEKAQGILRMAKKYNPVNFGRMIKFGGSFRPEKHLNLFSL
jgi:hypothetical protein